MNSKILISTLIICISAVCGFTMGNSEEYIPDDGSPRLARQVCNNCVVGPPSPGYNNRRPSTNYRTTPKPRPTQRNSLNRGYSTSSRSSSSYNTRGGYNNNNRGYQQPSNGCRCFGNTCFDCSIGK
ncbi:hypothetical protein ACKWTF_011476 [Chironomus riparius]